MRKTVPVIDVNKSFDEGNGNAIADSFNNNNLEVNPQPTTKFPSIVSTNDNIDLIPINISQEYQLSNKINDTVSVLDKNVDSKLTFDEDKFSKRLRFPRFHYSKKQVDRLMRAFKKNKYISKEEAEVLAEDMGITSKRILVWFKNSRCKHRKKELNRPKDGKKLEYIPILQYDNISKNLNNQV